MKFLKLFLVFVGCIGAAEASIKEHLQGIPAGNSMICSFEQRQHLDALEEPIISRGFLTVLPSKGLIWEIQQPFKNTIIITKSGIYHLENNDFNTLSQTRSSQTDFFEVLSSILDGTFSNALKYFKSESLRPEKDFLWHTKLTPTTNDISTLVKFIKIQGKEHIFNITIQRRNNDFDEIFFKDHRIQPESKSLTKQQSEWFNEK